MIKYLLLVFALIFISCGPGSDLDALNKVSKPNYCFDGEDENGKRCTTGVIRFNTHTELCAGLQNVRLNSRCGDETLFKRSRYFKENCEGTFKPDYTEIDLQPLERCSEIVVRR